MNELFKKIILAGLGIASLIALVTIGLAVGAILLGLVVILWVYLWLARKGIIKRPGNMHEHMYPREHAPQEDGDVIDADYEVVDEKNELPKG